MSETLSPLAMLFDEGASYEDLEVYFDRAVQTELTFENALLTNEELQEAMDSLGIDGHPFFSDKGDTITLHGSGSGISTRERMELADYLRRTVNL